MSHIRWLARRRAVASSVAVSLLTASALTLSGCGLFGGDDETPQVVEPPATAAQESETSSATPATTRPQQTEQQDQPSEAVAVTTSPSEDEDEQQDQAAAESSEPEEAGDPTIYIVQPGDTLAQIANRLGVRIDDLITLNGIQNPDLLRVGQELKIPGTKLGDEPDERDEQAEVAADEEEEEDSDEDQIEPPSVELPTVAVPAATPTQVSYTQFPQPGPEQTTDTIPDAPSNFLQYGAAALPWLHGINTIEPIIELFKAWPMPSLAVGNDRVVLVDTNANGEFSASIIYTDPNSFGAAVPYSNLVVYDPVPGDPSKYRIAYDHAQAYAREVQGIQQLGDIDMTGDASRDVTFREITCDASGCVSSFYILASTGDGYRTITGSVAQVAEVSSISMEDLTGDGVPDIVVDGLATDQATAARYTFVFTAQGDSLVESVRLSLNGDSSEEPAAADTDEDSLEE